MQNIFDISPDHIVEQLKAWQEPKFRVQQILTSAWNNPNSFFTTDSTLPLKLRLQIKKHFFIPDSPKIYKSITDKDGTCKITLKLLDNSLIESVAIPQKERLTFCLSSQVGCNIGCKFCATAKMGFIRNLTASEIILQLHTLTKLVNKKPTNIVFMGMGEPLQNLTNLRIALEIISKPYIWNWNSNKTLVSTCGWLPGIEAIIANPIPARLAVSLNSINNKIRSQLMPINQKFSLEKLLATLQVYNKKIKKTITCEYVLIKNINDSILSARILARILKKLKAKLNLIPYNNINHDKFLPPDKLVLNKFLQELKKNNIITTLRLSKGNNIKAACGQLATAYNRRKK